MTLRPSRHHPQPPQPERPTIRRGGRTSLLTAKSAILAASAIASATFASTTTADPQRVRIDRDNIEIRESCVIPAGEYRVDDRDGNGVLHIVESGVTVEFEPGARLIGSAPEQAPDEYTGVGVRIDGAESATIRGGEISGFKVGLFATGADGLTIERLTLRDNYRKRLGSTPAAEDSSDWIYPHRNHDNEWMTNYGAAIYLENASAVTVRDVTVRETQNGIVLDRITDSKVYDNDCSFLSGWGLAMWRSSRNVVSRNAFDFCVRGYSHGVYNRGQDSAGILMFEQNNENVVAENSATHGGDGFFGFGGRDALGEAWLDEERERLRRVTGKDDVDALITILEAVLQEHRRLGNNDNLLIDNDFSYAAAHGIEMTFSFGNRFIGNRLVENSICGVWGGYSDDTLIAGNEFAGNGDGAYGMERGGVNIEHGAGNRVEWNTFRENKCGVYFWWDPDPGLAAMPWSKSNGVASQGNSILHNRFNGDEIAVQLRKSDDTAVAGNDFENVGTKIDADEESEIIRNLVLPAVVFSPPEYPVYGDTKPVGARDHLRGRHNIVMTEWGPWDHASPLLRQRSGEPGAPVHEWELQGAAPIEGIMAVEPDHETLITWGIEWGRIHPEQPEERINIGSPPGTGVFPYRVKIKAGDWEGEIRDQFVIADWTVRVFPWTNDPREDLNGWRSEARGDEAVTAHARSIAFRFGGGGPGDVAPLRNAIGDNKALGADHFGLIATTELQLEPGRYEVTTMSDDGVRVRIDDETVIDNWTWHGPTRNTGEFFMDSAGMVEIAIEYFEIDGWAQLEFDIERTGDAHAR